MIYRKDSTAIIPLDIESLEKDLHIYEAMFNDPEIGRLTSNGRFAYDSKITKANIDSVNCILWQILAEEDLKTPIGLVSLQRINLVDRSAEFAIYLGSKQGQGHGYRAGWMVLHHGFRRLGLHRIWTGTSMLNKPMQKLAKKLDMKEEGRFREAIMTDGKLFDVVAYAVLSNEWNELKSDPGFIQGTIELAKTDTEKKGK